MDPIISGISTGTHLWGQFLKDYVPTELVVVPQRGLEWRWNIILR